MRKTARLAAENTRKFGDDRRMEEVQDLSHQGVLHLCLFLLLSTAFFLIRDIDLLAPLNDQTRMILGSPPPAVLTRIAMLAYTFSAGTLIGARLMAGFRPSLRWSHLFFRTVFYPFFLFSNALAEHFMAAFIAGLVLITLEHLNIWTYSLKSLPGKREVLGKL